MTLAELVTRFYDLANEDPDNSSFSEERVINWLNEAYRDFCSQIRMNEMLTVTRLDVPYAVLTVASSPTLLTMASTEGFKLGQYVSVGSSSRRESVRITGLTLTTLTISPSLVQTYAIGSTVAAHAIHMTGHSDIAKVFSDDFSSTEFRRTLLKGNNSLNFIEEFSIPLSESEHERYTVFSCDNFTELSFTADTGTNALEVIVPVLTDIDKYLSGYFDDYYLCNLTRNRIVRISDYNLTTRTFTLAEAIDGQIATDTVEIQRRASLLWLYPLADGPRSLNIWYWRPPVITLEEDDSVPEIHPSYHMALVWHALSQCSIADKNFQMAGQYLQYYTLNVAKARHDAVTFSDSRDYMTFKGRQNK